MCYDKRFSYGINYIVNVHQIATTVSSFTTDPILYIFSSSVGVTFIPSKTIYIHSRVVVMFVHTQPKTAISCSSFTKSYSSLLFLTSFIPATPDSPCVFCRDTVSHHLPCHSMPPCNQDHGTDIQTLSVCVWSRYSQPTQPPECVVPEDKQ